MSRKLTNAEAIAKAQKERDLKRIAKFFKPLMSGFKSESITMKETKQKMRGHSYKGNIIIKSDEEIYRHICMLALSKEFDMNTEYLIYPIDDIIDVWFNNHSEGGYSIKNKFRNVDVLILIGKNSTNRVRGPINRVLIEIMETRISFGKNTWIFITTKDETRIYDQEEPEDYSIISYATNIYNYKDKGEPNG
jgi:hypothetical protein